MKDKSNLTKEKCLLADLDIKILAKKENEFEKAKMIESLFGYGIGLYDGIVKNHEGKIHEGKLSGKFDFSYQINESKIFIYKKIKEESVSKQEYEDFLTAISIMQMVTIDENVYLSGAITLKEIYYSKNNILWGCKLSSKPNNIKIVVDDSIANLFDNKFVKRIKENCVLDFLPNVYRFSPFKEEEGNMMRHIVTPLNSVKKENESLLSDLVDYCRQYISEKKFNLNL